jgi:predicted  nucleic acid-binding Zn-ribbon protein
MITWIFDALLCVALIGAMVVGTKLWRKIDSFKSGQNELKDLLKQLNAASEQAQTSILQLRATLKEADSKLGDRLDRARALSDELSIITESGDRLASRITDEFAEAPPRPRKTVADIRRTRAPAMAADMAPSRSESDALAKILQGLR